MESKAYHSGTHRTLTPAQTLQRVQPLLTRMGITRVANVTGLDRVGIPVYTSFRPQSRSISVSQGKGLESAAAKVSAIMESVETFHAERIHHDLKFGSINDLGDQIPLANIDQLPRSSQKPLLADMPIFWTEGKNLVDNRSLWVPFEMVNTDYTLPYLNGSGYFAANTNGLASGNTLNEATCHAIYEVVERDAETLWNQLPVRKQITTGIDQNSIHDSNCQWLLEQFMKAEISIKIWDMTSDIGLPSYICLTVGDENDWADPEFGAGTHACKEVALCRALTETAQARATYIAGSRDDVGWSEYQARQRQKRRAQGHQQLQKHQPSRQFNQLDSFNNSDMADDLQLCIDLLTKIGIKQIISIDLSKPEFGLSVVKVVIPGLEGAYGHWHSSYVLGPRAKALLDLPFEIRS